MQGFYERKKEYVSRISESEEYFDALKVLSLISLSVLLFVGSIILASNFWWFLLFFVISIIIVSVEYLLFEIIGGIIASLNSQVILQYKIASCIETLTKNSNHDVNEKNFESNDNNSES